MSWEFSKENGKDMRTCNICNLSQIKCDDGEWVTYLTKERMNKFFENLFAGISEECVHTFEEMSR